VRRSSGSSTSQTHYCLENTLTFGKSPFVHHCAVSNDIDAVFCAAVRRQIVDILRQVSLCFIYHHHGACCVSGSRKNSSLLAVVSIESFAGDVVVLTTDLERIQKLQFPGQLRRRLFSSRRETEQKHNDVRIFAVARRTATFCYRTRHGHRCCCVRAEPLTEILIFGLPGVAWPCVTLSRISTPCFIDAVRASVTPY